MSRPDDLERLYDNLTLFSRRSRELSGELHPGLSLVAYTFLSHVDDEPGVRAADLCAAWGLDKSTVSRQVDQLVGAGHLARTGERPGRRGQVLELTGSGRRALADAAMSIRSLLVERLDGWSDADVATFALLLERFNS